MGSLVPTVSSNTLCTTFFPTALCRTSLSTPCLSGGPVPREAPNYTTLAPFQGLSGVSSSHSEGTGHPWLPAGQSHFSKPGSFRSAGRATHPRPTPEPNNAWPTVVINDQDGTPECSHAWARGQDRCTAVWGLDAETLWRAGWGEGDFSAFWVGIFP